MTIQTAAAISASQQPPKRSLLWAVGWGLFVLLMAWAWQGADIRPIELIRDSDNMRQLARDFFPPDFTDWRIFLREMVATFHIALWGTFLAVISATLFGLLSASNIAPPWVYQPVRRMMDACRAINEMVFAMIFIVAVGLGPFAGVLALWVHTTGTLAKLFAEAVEAVDPRPVEGIRSTGANPVEEIIYGIIPQVLPLWISFTLYRFESNVRSASVVGMVGAGGIGVILFDTLRGFQYPQACAVILIIIVSVTVIDMVSARIRQWAI